ncbi:MAG: methyltransferase domain-containing protein [Terrimonas sp.]|nr:methyltransferase domain-containing protein [Terrimonas sp.]
MADKTWYENWFNSPFYHKLYFQRDEKEARFFLAALIDYLKPFPGSNWLDVACGRGRLSRILAENGFEVTGFDIAPRSIEYARPFENKHLSFFQHDMRRSFRINYYDFVINFFTSFGYFNTRREHDDAIRTMAVSLKKGGILIIDYLNTHYVEDHLVREDHLSIEGTSFDIHRWEDEHFFYKKIRINDPSLAAAATHTEKIAKFSLGDFTDMLSFQHLQVRAVFGDYALGAYDTRNTPRLIIIADKGKS